ncbi:MAG: tetratricopeptide repeat protein [Candidatus Hodarchaeota archaeon]
MKNKQIILYLIDQNKFNEALVIIDNLETNSDLVLEDYLSIKLLKSQILVKSGLGQKGLELAKETLTVIRDQIPRNLLLQVDAIIALSEASCQTGRLGVYFSIKNLSEYLQLLEQGEQLLKNILKIEPLEIAKRAAVIKKIKGHIYVSMQEFGHAEESFQESITLHKKEGNLKGVIEVLTEQANIHYFRNEYELLLGIYHDCLRLSEELGDREQYAEILGGLAVTYHCKGELENAATYIQRSLQLANELPPTVRVARLLFQIGLFYQDKSNEVASALDTYQKSVAISERLGDKDGIVRCFHLLGDLYQYSKGNFNKALEYYEGSMALFDETGDSMWYGWNLTDAGNLYHLKGELDLALDYCQKALSLFEEIGNEFYFCQTLLHLGRVYRSKGDNDLALDYYKRCLNFLEEKRLRFGQDTEGLAYHEIIAVMLDNKDINEAKQYFERFHQYFETEKDKRVLNKWYKLSEALILKTSYRIADKAKAQQLFQEVIDDPNSKYGLLNYLADSKKSATLNLCELLLFELKSSSDEITEESEIFQEIKGLLDNLASSALRQHSIPLLVNTLILQAKFTLVEGNLTDAMDLLNRAKAAADEKNLRKLGEKVSEEKTLLVAQLDTWEVLIQNNAPLKERLARIQLEEYIMKASKIIHIE